METRKQPIVRIFYTSVKTEFQSSQMQQYLDVLTPPMRDTIMQYHNWRDRQCSLFGKLLLRMGLESFGLQPGDLSQMLVTDYDRPYLASGIDFNISHSGDQVICAVSTDVKVGIDIEQVRPVDLTEYQITMTEKQWKHIYESEEPYREFFNLWALKESVIKADGRGLSIPLTSLETDYHRLHYDDRSWYVTPLRSPQDYAAYLATNLPAPRIEYISATF